MDKPLYYLARGLVALVQALPLTWVARLGRAGGALAYWLDARHRRVAGEPARCYGREKSAAEIRALARENFRRIGESFACAVKTAAMTLEEPRPHVEFVASGLLATPAGRNPAAASWPPSAISAISTLRPLWAIRARLPMRGRHRGLPQPSLNRLLQSLRANGRAAVSSSAGSRRRRSRPLCANPGLSSGLLADQHGGPGGLRLPFLGQELFHFCRPRALCASLPLRAANGHLLSRRPGPLAHRGGRRDSHPRKRPAPLHGGHHARR